MDNRQIRTKAWGEKMATPGGDLLANQWGLSMAAIGEIPMAAVTGIGANSPSRLGEADKSSMVFLGVVKPTDR
jgi:hypothetical protein